MEPDVELVFGGIPIFFKNFKIKIFCDPVYQDPQAQNSMNNSWNSIEIDVCVCSLVHVVQKIAQHLSIATSNQEVWQR